MREVNLDIEENGGDEREVEREREKEREREFIRKKRVQGSGSGSRVSQKRPTIEAKETYYRGKRDLL
jgi:hypothetical protein